MLAAAYYFYGRFFVDAETGHWNYTYLLLLIASTTVDYACGLAVDKIERPAPRKLFVAVSMALNLGLLGYFKYYDFFATSVQAALASGGIKMELPTLKVLLPVGISFYTFQSMSYVIDVYRREIKPTRNFLQFAAFVSFFPHLVAGPIMRPTTLLPQLERRRRFDLQQFYSGSYLIFWGLAKKIVVADNLAVFVKDLFERWHDIDGGLALLAVYAFAFQIYCDFSGYTDVARGVAKMLGIELALNFNLPYFATSPQDFWNRWHISLSSWLRDYLYIPLGGNREAKGVWAFKGIFGLVAAYLAWLIFGPMRYAAVMSPPKLAAIVGLSILGLVIVLPSRGKAVLYRNLMLTMIIGGLWHGASWTFVAWGAYQGAILVAHRLLKPLLDRIKPAEGVDAACWKCVRIFVTFHLVCLGWLLFRAQSMEQAFGMLSAITTKFAIPASSVLLPILVCIVPLLIVQIAQYVSNDLEVIFRTPWYVRSVFYAAVFYAIILGGEFGGKQFIYMQF